MKVIVACRMNPTPVVKQLIDHGVNATASVISGRVTTDAGLAPMDENSMILLIVPTSLFAMEWIREVRRCGSKCLIFVILPSEPQFIECDIIEALTSGADEAQPMLDIREMAARIFALQRRSLVTASPIITIGSLKIDVNCERGWSGNEPLHLTGYEYSILEKLALRKGLLVTREAVCAYVYSERGVPNSNTTNVIMCRLRKKLAGSDAEIVCVWGRGYLLHAAVLECAA